MEYNYYLEQHYNLRTGKVECKLLSASEAEAKGYEDGYVTRTGSGRIYVDGFDTTESAKSHFEDLIDAVWV